MLKSFSEFKLLIFFSQFDYYIILSDCWTQKFKLLDKLIQLEAINTLQNLFWRLISHCWMLINYLKEFKWATPILVPHCNFCIEQWTVKVGFNFQLFENPMYLLNSSLFSIYSLLFKELGVAQKLVSPESNCSGTHSWIFRDTGLHTLKISN